MKNAKSSKRIETLSELCRKLQVKNKDLSDDLKMAKTNLFNQGITLQFKSDVKEKSSPKKNELQSQLPSPLKPAGRDNNNKAMDIKKKVKGDEEEDNERDEEDDAPNVNEVETNGNDKDSNMQITVTKAANDDTIDSKHEEEPLDIEPSPQPTGDDEVADDDKQTENDILLAESNGVATKVDLPIDDVDDEDDDIEDTEKDKTETVESEQAATF